LTDVNVTPAGNDTVASSGPVEPELLGVTVPKAPAEEYVRTE